MNGSADTPVQAAPLTEFERQRATAVRHVAANLDKVLLNLNKLNRNLQGITALGQEFAQVEMLWSRFENVMAKDNNATPTKPTTHLANDEK